MTESSSALRLGAILYPGFEMLDLFGPLEMFSMLGSDKVQIVTVAEEVGEVAAAIGFEGAIGPKVIAEHSFASAPQLDILLLPGGFGTLAELDNDAMLDFLRQRSERAQAVASVCSGSAILARAGLLAGLPATSNKQLFALAVQQSEAVDWKPRARWVDAGKMLTSSGVSAGMDMSLALIERLFGADAAHSVARLTEYVRQTDPAEDPFADDLNEAARALGMV